MKKSLLLGAALMCAAAVSAQTASVEAKTIIDEDWAASYDGSVMLENPVTVDLYDGYVIIKGWLGAEAQDLKVTFDEEENVTSVTPINDGVEGKTTKSGYASISTSGDNYYYVQLYLASGYNYASYDDSEGYVILSGYFYKSEEEYEWMIYYLYWNNNDPVELGELQYSTEAATGVYEDWGDESDFYAPGTPVGVDVYTGGIMLKSAFGAEGYDLFVQYDDEAAVTAITLFQSGVERSTAKEGSYLGTYTGNESLYYVDILVEKESDYAYVSDDESYVLLTCTFYDEDNAEHPLYYYVSWSNSGIASLDAANAAAEYYNLQGMRVFDPVKGQLLIKKQGEKAAKTIIR